ncbi:MAG: hypothetical protein KatS3mg121_0166 [Gammaproteobacteria bacterium]|nr:MAG: hypothetical protein KatS3mg121_0166 [Gammaproteobacteria bacterium]
MRTKRVGVDNGRLSYFGGHYRHVAHRLVDIGLGADTERISGHIELLVGPSFAPTRGLGAGRPPHFTALDMLVCGAQLAQALLYHLDGIDRSRSENLWMRSVELHMPSPIEYVCGRALLLDVTLERTRVIPRRDGTWRTAELCGATPAQSSFAIRAALAHRIPNREETRV